MPDPIIVGRNADKVGHPGGRAWHRPPDHRSGRRPGQPGRHAVLRRRHAPQLRPGLLRRPSTPARTSIAKSRSRESLDEAVAIARYAKEKGVKNGIVHDKLDLPGLQEAEKTARFRLLRPHPLGPRRVRLLGFRRRHDRPRSALSWNYRGEPTAAASSSDMLCHWRYVLDNTIAPVQLRQLPHRDPYPRALATRPASPTTPPPTTPPTRVSCSKATSSRRSIPAGAPACAATIW